MIVVIRSLVFFPSVPEARFRRMLLHLMVLSEKSGVCCEKRRKIGVEVEVRD